MIKYIVVWCDNIRKSENKKDHYAVYSTLKEARKKYNSLIKYSKLYSASITKIIESTDYL